MQQALRAVGLLEGVRGAAAGPGRLVLLSTVLDLVIKNPQATDSQLQREASKDAEWIVGNKGGGSQSASATGAAPAGSKPPVTCYHCGQQGHYKNRCPFLQGQMQGMQGSMGRGRGVGQYGQGYAAAPGALALPAPPQQ